MTVTGQGSGPVIASRLLSPAVTLGEYSLVRDLAMYSQRGVTTFFRHGDQWRSVDARRGVGVPPTRRVVELPSSPVEPISLTDVIVPEEFRKVEALPVLDQRRGLVGAVTRTRWLSHATDPDAAGSLRRQIRSFVHDANNAISLATLSHGIEDAERTEIALERLRGLVGGLEELLLARPAVVSGDLGAVVRQVARTCRLLLNVSIAVELRSSSTVPMSPSRLERVLYNLIANAARAGAEHIEVRTFDSGVDSTTVEVQDDGPGIAPEHLERVLEAGYSTTGGRGLGLSGARDVVVSAGGALQIDSRLGVGTTIRIALPLAG